MAGFYRYKQINSINISHFLALSQYDEEDASETREGEEDPTDCISDRNAAMRDGGSQFYVPECTPDGRYKKVIFNFYKKKKKPHFAMT